MQQGALQQGADPYSDPVSELRNEMSSKLARAEEELQQLRAETSSQHALLRSENQSLRDANSQLAGKVAAREREGDDARRNVRETLEERNRAVAAVETRLHAIQTEYQQQREGVLSDIGQRDEAVERLESQLRSVQSQLVTVLQAQLQQRDDARKLASAPGLMQQTPLSIEEVEPTLQAPVALASSAKLIGEASHLQFGTLSEQREALMKRLEAPRRSVAQEFAANEGGMWLREYNYVVHQTARELWHERGKWHAGAPAAQHGSADAVVRDEGHDGWTLDDFCNRPLAQAAGLTRAEVAILRLYTGPAHAPLQLFMRSAASGAAVNGVQRGGAGGRGLVGSSAAAGNFAGGGAGGAFAGDRCASCNDGSGSSASSSSAAAAASGDCESDCELLTCNARPYYVHFSGERRSPLPFLFVADVAHRTSTGETRCAHCRRPRREHSQQPLHDWSTSVTLLCSAVEKLAMWSPPMCAYRPLREESSISSALGGGTLPPTFVPTVGEAASRAVTAAELGVLSATTDKQVALALSGGKASHTTILEISFDYTSRGASLQWLSQYPYECEVAFPPCTALLPHGLRQWSERRRVIAVQATPSSMHVRADSIVSLEASPSGAVHGLAAKVSQSMSGLGASITSSVGMLFAGGKVQQPASSSSQRRDQALPPLGYAASGVGSRSDDGGAACGDVSSLTARAGAAAALEGGAGTRVGETSGSSSSGDLAARSAARRASSSAAAAVYAAQSKAAAYATAAAAAGFPPPDSPPRSTAVLNPVLNRSGGSRHRGGVGKASARAAPLRADQPIPFGQPVVSGRPSSAISPGGEQWRPVLTINDALELIEGGGAAAPAPPTNVQRHLDAAETNLQSAAAAVPVWVPMVKPDAKHGKGRPASAAAPGVVRSGGGVGGPVGGPPPPAPVAAPQSHGKANRRRRKAHGAVQHMKQKVV